ncbi:MAG: diaminopimelate decarboxylase family protein, partial [Treponema sp.]
TTADVITKNVHLPVLDRGDILVFENVGAYSVTEGIALFLSRTMPRIVLYHGRDDMRLARDFIESSTFNTIAETAR